MSCAECPVFQNALRDACINFGLELVYGEEAIGLQIDDRTKELIELAKAEIIFQIGYCGRHFDYTTGIPMANEPVRHNLLPSRGPVKG